MAYGSSPSTGLAQHASDPGLEALALPAVLASHEQLLGRIKLCLGADHATFERELMPLVRGYAGFVHLLPATASNYFHRPGGLLQLGLETAFFSLQGTDAHIFSGRATISERREMEPRWRIATFIGGLCCELHRALSHLSVITPDGQQWPAFLGGLSDWLTRQRASRYFVHWRANARESRELGLFALPHVIAPDVLQMLGQGNTIILAQLMASIGGIPQYREHNVLDQLVRRSMALVIDRNLLAGADHHGMPQYGSHLERYLIDALRRLAVGHSSWTPNREKSRVWFASDGLFLVWPGAAEDVLSLLESQQLAGIPKSPDTLLELLLKAEVCVAPDATRQTWSILPPGVKTPLEAVKLTTAAIVLAGLEPMPVALPDKLLAALGPETSSIGATAASPTFLPEEPAQPNPVPRQLSFLADSLGVKAPEASSAALAAPAATVINLKAPMRLNPSVRSALAEAVAMLNGTAGASDVCTIAQGIFVPLAEFERRGIQPEIAIRALEDTHMLRRAAASGSPTLGRQIRNQSVMGLILAPQYVEGLDQSLFAPADAPAGVPTPVPQPHRKA